MEKVTYKQFIVLATVAVFIIVGIANYSPAESPSGYSTRYDVTSWTCTWDNGWKWIGETNDYTWKLGSLLSETEAYCKDGIWTCKKASGELITEIAECDYSTDGAICTCAR